MIVVKVELHSAINGSVQTLGTAVIHNVGGTHKLGDYEVVVGKKTDAQKGKLRSILDKPLRRGTVEKYPRLSYNVWRLVIRALRSAFPEEK